MGATAVGALYCWLCGWQLSEAGVVREDRDDRRPTCSDCARIRYGPRPTPRKPRPGRDEVARSIFDAIRNELPSLPADAFSMLEVLVRRAPDLSTARKVALAFDSKSSSLQSRFTRAGLPSLKNYLSLIRLVYAAWYFDDEASTCGMVAYRLDYSSPQAFARNVRTSLGLRISEFRAIGFQVMLDRFISSQIRPYRDRLQRFHPLRKKMQRSSAPVAA